MITGNYKFITLMTISLAVLTACKGTESSISGKALDSMRGKKAATEARLSTAAAEAIAQGKTDEAVSHFSKLYKSDSKNPDAALNYAQVLRKTGEIEQAHGVLSPFTVAKKNKSISPVLLNEYAAIQIQMGNLSGAEETLSRVLDDKEALDLHADAYNLLGIVQDARGNHKEAERMFRAALDGWQGNPTSVMNNLALCLAGQGLFDESLTTLRKALIMAPDKQEIARNIDLVNNLRNAVIPAAPVKIHKN